jgi:hypothetical protein
MDDTDTPASEAFAAHAQTYHRFTLAVKWVLIVHAALITFLVLYFATSASFLGAFVVGAIIFGGGAWAMRHGLSQSSERESATPVPVGEMRRQAH